MFVLTDVKDVVKIEPQYMGKDVASAIADEINKKYANKVLHNIGLCICLHDLLSAEEGKVRWGDGCLYHRVTFRLVVFRPFVGEVLVGKVKSATKDHVRVTMDFFDDIYIPADFLPEPSAFDHTEATHFWLPEPSDPSHVDDPLLSDPSERLFIDPHQTIRFRVERDEFNESNPGPTKGDGGSLGSLSGPAAPTAAVAGTAQGSGEGERLAPYVITGSITDPGLGLLAWWGGEQTAEGEEETEMS